MGDIHPGQQITTVAARARLLAALGLAVLLSAGSGCAPVAQLAGGRAASDGTEAVRARLKSYYVRVQPEATGLVSIDDDGENTFLEFSILPPGELRFFDAAGKPLRAVWVRNMAALRGTHKGILMRLGTATSYASVNPLAESIRKPAMPETAQVFELRERLLQEGPRREMEQIAARIASAETDPAAAAGVSATGAGVSGANLPGAGGPGAAGPGAGLPAGAAVSVMAPTTAVPTTAATAAATAAKGAATAGAATGVGAVSTGPAAAANAGAGTGTGTGMGTGAGKGAGEPAAESNDAGWPRTQRVFFATNSVGISAPDDGLHRIVSDARLSDEIWISGHTDNKGPRTVNMQLAKRRAEAIKYILTSRGIAPERIIIVNAPLDTYLAANETEVGRAQNRRADVTFVRGRSVTAPRVGLATN